MLFTKPVFNLIPLCCVILKDVVPVCFVRVLACIKGKLQFVKLLAEEAAIDVVFTLFLVVSTRVSFNVLFPHLSELPCDGYFASLFTVRARIWLVFTYLCDHISLSSVSQESSICFIDRKQFRKLGRVVLQFKCF